MSLRIGNNIDALRAQRALSNASHGVSTSLSRLSSGQRINSPSDDAAGLAISSSLDVSSRVYREALKNANDIISVTSVATSALESLRNISMRQGDLASQAATGTYSSIQRQALATESQKLTEEYNRIISSTSFNGRNLFTSPWEQITAQLGFGEENTMTFSLGSELNAGVIETGDYFDVYSVSSSGYVRYYFSVNDQTASVKYDSDIRSYISISPYTNDVAPTKGSADISISDPSLIEDGSYLLLSSPESFAEFGYARYFWFDKGGPNGDPGAGDPSGVRVDITGASTAIDVRDRLIAAVQGYEYTAEILGDPATSTEIRITDKTAGLSYDFFAGTYSGADPTVIITSATFGEDKKDQCITTEQIGVRVATVLTQATYSSATSDPFGTITVTQLRPGPILDPRVGTSPFQASIVTTGSGGQTFWPGESGDVEIADLNGDGLKDFIAPSSWYGGSMMIGLNRGDGVFDTFTRISLGTRSNQIKAADLNNDGAIDLVSSNGGGDLVAVALNQGDGTFGAVAILSVNEAYGLQLADLDGNGAPDIVVKDNATYNFVTLMNQGDGTFASAVSISAPRAFTQSTYSLQDISGDGRPDIVAYDSYWTGTTYMNVGVLRNDGDGTFSPATYLTTGTLWSGSEPYVEDMDGNGTKDILYLVWNGGSYEVRTLLNNGGGAFSAPLSSSGGAAHAYVSMGDVNGDRVTDIVTYGGNLTTGVRLGLGNGTFAATQTYTMSGWGSSIGAARFSDMNGDGRPDLVAAAYDGSISVRLNNGNGTFGTLAAYSGNGNYYDLALSDLTGDGINDVLSAQWGSLRYLTNDGAGGLGNNFEVFQIKVHDGRGTAEAEDLDLSNVSGARAAISTISARLERICAQLSAIGVIESRIAVSSKRLIASADGSAAARSRIIDADIAAESAALLMHRTRLDASAAVLAQANQRPQLALMLLQSIG